MTRLSKLRGGICALFALASLQCLSALPAQIEDLRLGRYDDKTRLVLDLSGPVEYSITTLDKPPRLILNLPQVHIDRQFPVSFKATPLAGMNIETSANDGLQITFNLDRPVHPKSFLLKPGLSHGDRLVVDFYELSPQPAANSETPASTPLQEPLQEPLRETAALEKPKPKKPVSAHTSAQKTVFSGTWEQEWAYQTHGAGSQKFETLLEPRVDVSFSSGAQLVAIARVRLDAVGDLGATVYRPDSYSELNGPLYNTENAQLSLRELYLDTQWAGAYWRLGKQQVVWGQADGIKVLDVVNPQSFREFILDDFDDSRIPLWMVKAELPLGESSLQFLWIPDTTYHELAEADTPYFLTSPKWVPTLPLATGVQVSSLNKPNNPLKDSDVGLRYSAFLGGWDLTLNYLYHYQDYPVLYQQLEQLESFDVLHITPTYKRNHLVGGTVSNAFSAFTVRAELAYSTDTYHNSCSLVQKGICESPELASVVGLDWQYSGEGLLSAQWFQSYLTDYSRDIVRDQTENNVSLLYQQNFANAAWQLRVLGVYSLNDEDSMLQFKLKYWLLSDLEVWLGGDLFNGSRHGSFGQFDTQDRMLLGFEYGF